MTRRGSKRPGLALALLLAVLMASSTLGQEGKVAGRIIAITDGDTVKALIAGNQLLRIRLSWIDAPESSQAFGQRSKQHLSELIFGREVELHTRGLDRYGRTLATIYVDGVDANLDQVRSGSAWVYEHYISEAPLDIQASYHAAQLAAQQERRGLWSDTQEPMPPWRRANPAHFGGDGRPARGFGAGERQATSRHAMSLSSGSCCLVRRREMKCRIADVLWLLARCAT